jgi:hypothetical protein
LAQWVPRVFALELAVYLCLTLAPQHLRAGRVRANEAIPELTAGCALMLLCFAAAWSGRSRLTAPLALASLAKFFVFLFAGPIWLRFSTAPIAWLALPFALALAAGLHLALRTVPGGFVFRAATVWFGFVLPTLLAQLLSGGPRFRAPWLLGQAGTLALLALLAAWPGRPSAPKPVPLRRALAWVVAGAILALSLSPLQEWLRARRRQDVARTLAALPLTPEPNSYPTDWFHRGVNFTANGVSYESPLARDLLRQLPTYGIREIAIVPYGFADRESGLVRLAASGSWESDDGVRLLAAEAHRLGMKVMLKPHVWRPGARSLETREQRLRWLASYESFLLHYARLAASIRADLFCVGVELAGLSSEEGEWRRLIALTRTHYRGPLVYAATQGPEFESIRFWDALDYIGLDNYYPLTSRYEAGDMLARITAVQAEYAKPVLLTEAGYSSSPGAHRTPWDDRRTGPVDLDEQVRCYQALYRALHDKPWFRGIYWWKIETDRTGGPRHPGMAPWDKPAMQVVRSWNAKAHVSESSTPAAPRASLSPGAQP